ncbi:MAG TPA: hypothetical protein VNE41_06160 [Chitinophagaceae bacterium]|nr:hypothetical protein [Chitinophagaceae bacterium]
MLIDAHLIAAHNEQGDKTHRESLEFIQSKLNDPGSIMNQLKSFQVSIPSWAMGTGGTRFGRFAAGGEPRNLEEKIADAGLLHALTRSAGGISLHIPWDLPEDSAAIRRLAADFGLRFDAVNSNTFQDQPGQQFSYQFGSLQQVNPAIRRQAIDHHIEVIRIGMGLGSNALTIWLADGSSFPGQLNFRHAFENTLESLQVIYQALPENWKMFIEYKPYEPNFYSMTVADWGQSYLLASKLGIQAFTLVDLGHHLPGTNIEQIVSLLLMENKLGGFHFNDSKYGDDDLTAGSLRPYQLFLIFQELVEGMNARGMDHARSLSWMIDASHNIKDPLEDLLQSVEAIQIAYTQALIVDQEALNKARQDNDAAMAQDILQQAFRTDVRPLVAETRMRNGGALNPRQLFRDLRIREKLVAERGRLIRATGL